MSPADNSLRFRLRRNMRRNGPFEPSAQRTGDYPTIFAPPPAVATEAVSQTPFVLLQSWRVLPEPPAAAEYTSKPSPDTDIAASSCSQVSPEQSNSRLPDTGETLSQEKMDQADAIPRPQDVMSARELAEIGAESDISNPSPASGDTVPRFRRRVLTAARLLVFVLLPGTLAGWYFFVIASQLYMAEARFVIQAPIVPAAGTGAQHTAQDTSAAAASAGAALSDFLRSRPAMRQLDSQHEFVAHFQQEHVDPIRQLPPDASDDTAFQFYRRHVQIDHDTVTGIVAVRAWALSAEDSVRFAEALVHLARTHLDAMGADVRAEVLGVARNHLDDVQRDLISARQRQSELERALTREENVARAGVQLDARLRPSRVALQEARGNFAEPHPLEVWEDGFGAQLEVLPVPRRDTVATTQSADVELQRQLVAAQTDVETFELLRAQALAQIEQIQGEIARQSAALIVVVAPSAPDMPDYPRKIEYTAAAFLGLLGLFVLVTLTNNALRNRVSG